MWLGLQFVALITGGRNPHIIASVVPFVCTQEEELVGFEPDFTIVNACTLTNPDFKVTKPTQHPTPVMLRKAPPLTTTTQTSPCLLQRHGLRSEVFVGFNIEKGLGIIGGTHYGGEMKKGIFAMVHNTTNQPTNRHGTHTDVLTRVYRLLSACAPPSLFPHQMNYRLPLNGHMPMHCSANKGKDGDTALFFGLSGTGKTTLSADPHRFLIGDDEHGWDDEGIFNFEGGCYAKTIGLDAEKEPDIYNAIRRDALLVCASCAALPPSNPLCTPLTSLAAQENVVLKGLPLEIPAPDFDDASRTENGRVSYPIFHIDNYDKTSR